MPAFAWPTAPFPASRFPLEQHQAENRAAEARSLEEVEKILRANPNEVAAIIVEPIQGEGGDRHASDGFFCALRKMAREHGAAFIADEVQTGCATTGLWWAHEHWGLDEPPDMVTFSKKLQLGGFYLREDFFPADAYRIFNTFLGDPIRAAQLEVIVEVTKRDALLEQAATTGHFLVKGLSELQARYPSVLSQARGKGTFAAIDARDPETQGKLLARLRALGMEVGGSGTKSIRFRPALVFAPRHVAEALDKIETAAKELV
jgi:4-aminobutyrate aminotransferase/(S)-3-amino-2-methylpropionate transaminase